MNTDISCQFTNEKKELLEKILNYAFNDSEILLAALTHLSHVNEKKQNYGQSYEKLEFLGDAVLQLLISDLLFSKFDAFKEGELSRFRSHLVSEDNLAEISRQLGIGQFILLGKGEESSDGRKKNSILADVVESLIGAVYVDSYPKHGIEKVKTLVETWFDASIKRLESYRIVKNSRSLLCELAEKNGWESLEFRCIDESGLDHKKVYTYEIFMNNQTYGRGIAGSKKVAARIAAEKTLRILGYDTK